MFDTVSDARLELAAYLNGSRLDAVIAGLIPTLVFRPDTTDTDRVGRTRFGGAPDLPPGSIWPRPPAPADVEAIATRGSAEAAEDMRRHFATGLPYAFIAQIDLAEAAILSPATGVLPTEGLLLFF